MLGRCKTVEFYKTTGFRKAALVLAGTLSFAQMGAAQSANDAVPMGPEIPAPMEMPTEAPLGVTPLDDAGFDARTLGRTIHYNSYGAPYGVEEYLPDHKVKWIFAEGQCKMGEWFQSGDQICFTYQDEPDLQCWIFSDQPQGLMAWFNGAMTDEPLVSQAETNQPLDCEMIDVGV